MKAYKIELLILDFDKVGKKGIKYHLENTKYPNHCISPEVKKIESAEIGEWHDDHPFNKKKTADDEYNRIFNS